MAPSPAPLRRSVGATPKSWRRSLELLVCRRYLGADNHHWRPLSAASIKAPPSGIRREPRLQLVAAAAAEAAEAEAAKQKPRRQDSKPSGRQQVVAAGQASFSCELVQLGQPTFLARWPAARLADWEQRGMQICERRTLDDYSKQINNFRAGSKFA